MGTFDKNGEYHPARSWGTTSASCRSKRPTRAPWSTSPTASWSRARSSVWTRTRCCSTSATSPRRHPQKSCRSGDDIDPSRSCPRGRSSKALVLQKEDKEGRLILSRSAPSTSCAWGRIEDIKSGGVVEGPVIEVVKVASSSTSACRASCLQLVELRRVRDLQPYVGRTLEAKIIELDKNRNNVVLSRRAWWRIARAGARSSCTPQAG